MRAALLLLSSCVVAKAPAVDAPKIALPENGWSREKATQHLLNRAAFGPSLDDRARVAEQSAGAWLYEQLKPGTDLELESRLVESYPSLQLSVTAALQMFP